MTIDVIKLMRFIEKLDPKYFKEIDLGRSTLYEYKAKPKKLYNARLSTVLKLNQYMIAFENQNTINIKYDGQDNKDLTNVIKVEKFIGVDTGEKHILSSSNFDFTKTFSSNTPTLNKITKEYKNSLKNANDHDFKTIKNTIKTKYITQIESMINQQVNEMIKYYKNDSIFIVGDNRNAEYSDKYSARHIIWSLVKKQLNRKLHNQNRVIFVDETGSSIKCPNCKKSKKSNRTRQNQFKCKKCGFFHNINDEVAAVNILNKYLQQL